MADTKYCEACETLKDEAPNMVANGFTDTECNHLRNNKGLSGQSDDCTDLNTLNDCLIGSMEEEVKTSNYCDWQTFIGDFISNLWTVLKAMICSICGLWDRVARIDDAVDKMDCIVSHMNSGFEFHIGEDETDNSYVVAGKGISFLQSGSGSGESEISLEYIAGGLVEIVGSLNFYSSNFTDASACWNYDSGGATAHKSASRQGNSEWQNTTGTTKPMAGGGELLFEIRLKKSAYPEIRELFNGSAFPTGGGAYHVNVVHFDEGENAFGQHGNSDTRHTVPSGWVYIQARMVSINYLNASGARYSPRGYMGIRFNPDEFVC